MSNPNSSYSRIDSLTVMALLFAFVSSVGFLASITQPSREPREVERIVRVPVPTPYKPFPVLCRFCGNRLMVMPPPETGAVGATADVKPAQASPR